MLTSTITSEGQITIPEEIRKALNLHPGDHLDFFIANGRMYIQPADVDVRSLSGLLYKPDRKPISLAEMDAAIVQGARESVLGDWTRMFWLGT